MDPRQLIRKKRDGAALTGAEYDALLTAAADYQLAAFLMAVYFRGMTPGETAEFTAAMIRSGRTLDLASIPGTKVDKHSTGGVGDKVSLIVAPLVASCGVPVPMISGRGLGHTGGTLDKLESIPGFRTQLTAGEFVETVRAAGLAFAGQTAELVPADRTLYAIRDVTATVDSFPLMAGSIMSKKIAEGADALVLNVTFGGGAFLPTVERAAEFARLLVPIGERAGLRTVAVLSSMDEPLGHAVGNWLEVEEAVACLRGRPVRDLVEVVEALGSMMLVLGGRARSAAEAVRDLRRALWSGRAYEKLLEVVRLQGGDPAALGRRSPMPDDLLRADVLARQDGVVSGFDTRSVGETAVRLGAGRERLGGEVDHQAGIIVHRKVGDAVRRGEPLATLLSRRSAMLEEGVRRMERAIEVGRSARRAPVVVGIVDADGEREWEPLPAESPS